MKKIESLALWLVLCALTILTLATYVKTGKQVEQKVGASGTRFPNGLSADSTSPNQGEVRGTTLTVTGNATISGTVTTVGTTTLGYTPNQPNVARTNFNAASSTLCSIQNTSGVDRVITGNSLLFTGTTGSGANTGVRAYVSAGRADSNATASSTVMTQNNVNVFSGMQTIIVGGPNPSSYYTSSTAFQTGVSGINTSTLVYWPVGWYYNVTSTAITSSTGSCTPWSFPLN